ncbi:MAG: MFS transporter [Chloroflexi bacterium]|nr:MFS transporter [Chloroflexota bacterium]
MTTGGGVADSSARRWRWEKLTGGGALLQDDSFRRLWLGRLFSHTALNATLFTLLVLAVGEGGGSSIKSALFITAYLLPTATLGTISGVLTDRLPKTLVLTAANIARVGLMLLILMTSVGPWMVYPIALLLAISSQFAGPAEAAAVPQLVRRDQLTVAISTSNFGGLVSQVVGFAILPPFFLNTVGPRPLFFVAAVLFGVSAVFFLGIQRLGSRDVDLGRTIDAVRDVRTQFAEAWEKLTRDTHAYMSVIIFVLTSTAALVAVTLMPRFTQETLEIPVRNSIFVFLPAAVGIVAALRLVPLLERRVPKVWLVGAGFGLLAVSFACIALTPSFGTLLEDMNPLGAFDPGPFGDTTARIVVAIIFSTAAAFSFSIVGVAGRSLVNERMPLEIQGRVFAAQVVLTNLASIPPILLAGGLSELAGVEPVMFLTVAILVATAGWALLRALSRPEPLKDAEAD